MRRYHDPVTRYRPLGPEDVSGPALDAVLFRRSVPWDLFVLVPAVLAVSVLLRLLLSMLGGYGVSWDVIDANLSIPVLGMLAGYGVTAWQQRGRPTWVRVSSLGIELAQNGDPVFIAWSQITAARVRRRWIFAILEVAPVDLYAVRSALPSRDLPRIRYSRGVPMFRIEVYAFRPGLPALRAALAQHQPIPGETPSKAPATSPR
jgi:hypothetical protein